ncbi:MAG: hypothetical protein V4611_02850 [Patescibacteria group bacterium]
MRGASTRVLVLPKATQLAYSLLFSLLIASNLPLVARAEEPLEPPTLVGYVEGPGVPNGTSQADSYDIIWTWAPPVSGLEPDQVPPENPDEAPAQQPTDIVRYGYELKNQNGLVAFGSVESNILSLTTTASEDGNYVLSIWSITREDGFSEVVSGSIAFVAPVPQTLPNLPPIVVPDPIDVTPVTDNPVSNGARIGGSTPIINKDTNGYITGNTNTNIFSVDELDEAVAGADTTAVVKQSKQGWLILGMAWYVWLIILVAVFFLGRWILTSVRSR